MKENPVAVALWLLVAGVFFCRHPNIVLLSANSADISIVRQTSVNLGDISIVRQT